MYSIVVITFLVGMATHQTGGDGASSIAVIPFVGTTEEACEKAAAKVNKGTFNIGTNPDALAQIDAYCVPNIQGGKK